MIKDTQQHSATTNAIRTPSTATTRKWRFSANPLSARRNRKLQYLLIQTSRVHLLDDDDKDEAMAWHCADLILVTETRIAPGNLLHHLKCCFPPGLRWSMRRISCTISETGLCVHTEPPI